MSEAKKWVKKDPTRENVFWPTDEMKKLAWVSDEAIYKQAAADPVAFWSERAAELHWFKKWDKAYDFAPAAYKWFVGGKTNLSYNSLDRHVLAGHGDRIALIWEPEPVEEKSLRITYKELLERVGKFANALKALGVKKGDRVGIYMPMIPEAVIAMQACVRIGAAHSVVFSAFSPESLRDRMEDAGAKVLITADGYYRRGKPIDLKKAADAGVDGTKVEKVVVVKRLDGSAPMKAGRDVWYHDIVAKASADCPAEELDAEHLSFLLYTSGTTGKPKGIMHTTGGYAVQSYATAKWNFDMHPGDIYWCTADVGWVTGHTYINYGPLMNGITSFIYEGSPDMPDYGRMWDMIQRHKITQLYTAPTLIRMLLKQGDEWPAKYDLSSLRILGTVGEPINVDAWMWYFEKIGTEPLPDHRHVVADRDRREHGQQPPRHRAVHPDRGRPRVPRRPRRHPRLGRPVDEGQRGRLPRDLQPVPAGPDARHLRRHGPLQEPVLLGLRPGALFHERRRPQGRDGQLPHHGPRRRRHERRRTPSGDRRSRERAGPE